MMESNPDWMRSEGRAVYSRLGEGCCGRRIAGLKHLQACLTPAITPRSDLTASREGLIDPLAGVDDK